MSGASDIRPVSTGRELNASARARLTHTRIQSADFVRAGLAGARPGGGGVPAVG